MFTACSFLLRLSQRSCRPRILTSKSLSITHRTSRCDTTRRWSSTSNYSRTTSDHAPSLQDSFPTYLPIEDIEPFGRYAAGGYYPVQIGDQFCGSRYRIVHRFGLGTSSTTWLARDAHLSKYVAIKFAVSGLDCPFESAIMRVLQDGEEYVTESNVGITMIPDLLNEFEVEGSEIDGTRKTHKCFVTTPARMNVPEAREAGYSRVFQPEVARAIAAQLIQAVAYMHSRGVIHADLHEANILFRLPNSIDTLTSDQLYDKYGQPKLEPITRTDSQPLDPWVPTHGVVASWLGEASDSISLVDSPIFLTDFGESFQPAVEARQTHTPLLLRAPELLLEPTLHAFFPAEIWSLACAVFYIMGQRPLFESWFPTENVFLREQVDTLGQFPEDLWARWNNRNEAFNDQLQRVDGQSRRLLEERLEYSIQEPRRDHEMEEMCEKEKQDFLVLMRSMLSFRPEDRLSAQDVLRSEWMQKWGSPVRELIQDTPKF